MGLVGKNVTTYSKSRIMWNAAFYLFGIDAEYIPFDIPRKKGLPPVLDLLLASGKVRGFNITVPYKEPTARHVWDSVDRAARTVGNVNTVHKVNGQVYAHSTDGYGAINSIEEVCGQGQIQGHSVLILGAGGFGSAVAVACMQQGAKQVYVANRNKMVDGVEVNSARTLAEKAKQHGVNIKPVTLYEADGRTLTIDIDNALYDSNVIINSLPPFKDGHPLSDEAMPMSTSCGDYTKIFMDANYGEDHRDNFLKNAASNGHRTVEGEWILLHQAVKAFQYTYMAEVSRLRLETADVAAPMRYAIHNFAFDAPDDAIRAGTTPMIFMRRSPSCNFPLCCGLVRGGLGGEHVPTETDMAAKPELEPGLGHEGLTVDQPRARVRRMTQRGQHAAPDLRQPRNAKIIELEAVAAQREDLELTEQRLDGPLRVNTRVRIAGLAEPRFALGQPPDPLGLGPAEQLARDQPAWQDVEPKGCRMTRVDHHHREPARLEHAPRLGDGAHGVDRVVQDAVGIDDVEDAIAEGQVLGVRMVGPALARQKREHARGGRDPLGCDIHGDHGSAVTLEQRRVRARAGADLEHPFAAERGDRHLDDSQQFAPDEQVLQRVEQRRQCRAVKLGVVGVGLAEQIRPPAHDPRLVVGLRGCGNQAADAVFGIGAVPRPASRAMEAGAIVYRECLGMALWAS